MFRLHDRWRRRACLGLFAVGCLVPTAGVMAWAVAWHLPAYVQAESEALGQRLGLEVSLDGVEHPRPGVTRYRGLELARPESREPVFRCRQLEAWWRTVTNRQGQPRSVLCLSGTGCEVEGRGLSELGRLASLATELRLGNAEVDVLFRADDEVTLRIDQETWRLADARGGVQTLAGGSQAWVDFRPAEFRAAQPARLRLLRNRQTDPPCDSFELDARATRLPCSMLALGLDAFGSLGPRARFAGRIAATRLPDGWRGWIEQGSFEEIELDQIVSARFGQSLSGIANVTIHQAVFGGGRVERLQGTVVAGPGLVSRSLLRAAVEFLELQSGADDDLAAPTLGLVVPYSRLAADFDLDATGLRIGWRGPSPQPAAILFDSRGRLLGWPGQPCPATALLAVLAPPTASYLPSSIQTDWLARRLPLPEPTTRNRPGNTGEPGNATLR